MSDPRMPKYLKIKGDLLRRIQNKEFAAGTALPSQVTLSRDYEVTLMTLRQALRSLEEDGMIVQMRGRGTFVTPSLPVLDLRSLSSLTEDMLSQGVKLTTDVLAVGCRALTKPARTVLLREQGDRALRLERLRRIGRRAVVHQVSWVPSPWAEQVDDVDFSARSLYGLLRERCSLLITAADEVIHAGPMPRSTARVARVTPGKPTMVAERTTYSSTGTPIVYDHAVILNDALRVTARRTQRDVRLSWATNKT